MRRPTDPIIDVAPSAANLADSVRAVVGDGVNAALELVGTPTLPDTLRAARVHGTVYFTSIRSSRAGRS